MLSGPILRTYDPVNPSQLADLICEVCPSADKADVPQKLHLDFLKGYLGFLIALKAAGKPSTGTIVIEDQYTDRDALVDFQKYYVRCHHDYERRCARLHFFDFSFTEEEFERTVLDASDEAGLKRLNDGYLGFVVVKNLPEAMFGRTCLKTYPEGIDERHYPIVRAYTANLFGLRLELKSLAFQEQDTVLAACATSALWSAFHFTSNRFQHRLLSPAEITENATAGMPLRGRALPSGGLTVEQMARAISSVGLEPEYLEPYSEEPYDRSDDWLFKATLYGYLRGKTPLLIGVVLARRIYGTDSFMTEGYHAVTAAGYRLNMPIEPESVKGVLLKSSEISRLYVHDDQVGPFSRIVFDDEIIVLEDGKNCFGLKTSWGLNLIPPEDIRFVPMCVVVPVYHKLRVPVTGILEEVFSLDNFIEWAKANGPQFGKARIIWDVYLDGSDHLKDDIKSERLLGDQEIRSLLHENLPRYVWRARATLSDGPLFEIIFDATDFERGIFCFRVLRYNAQYCDAIQALAGDKDVKQKRAALAAKRLLSLFVPGHSMTSNLLDAKLCVPVP